MNADRTEKPMSTDPTLYLVGPDARPAYYLVAEHLWGTDANIDSDGDSATPDDCRWTELSLRLRDGAEDAVVPVDPILDKPLILAIRSPDAGIVRRVAEYLQSHSGGTIREHVGHT
jgi:hypothetical protein